MKTNLGEKLYLTARATHTNLNSLALAREEIFVSVTFFSIGVSE